MSETDQISRLRNVAGLAIFVVYSGMIGCDQSKSTSPGKSAQQTYRVVLIGEGRDQSTWPILEAVASATNRDRPQLEVRLIGPQTDSPQEQRRLLEGITREQTEAICILPIDPAELKVAVSTMIRSGMPTVLIGRDIVHSDRAAYCGPTSSAVGRAAADACRLVTGSRASTTLLLHAGTDDQQYGPMHASLTNRLRVGRTVEILREMNCGGNPVDALRMVRAESEKYPRSGCWVFLDDWPYRALPRGERLINQEIGIVLCNASPRYLSGLQDGTILALVGYDLGMTVERALLIAGRLAEGETEGDPSNMARNDYIVEPQIITKATMADYAKTLKTWLDKTADAVSTPSGDHTR